MDNVLYKDEYHQKEVEIQIVGMLKRFLWPAAGVALFAALFVAFTEAYVFSFVFLFEAAICLISPKLRESVERRRSAEANTRACGGSYLHIYADRVVVKKSGRKEKIYPVSPSEYTVTLAHGGGRAGARLVYILGDKNGKRILRYVSDTWATNYKVLRGLMKYDIKDVGCRNVFDMVGILH